MRVALQLALNALVLLWCFATPPPASAAPLTRDTVPEPLRPWVDWVLRGHEEQLCPRLYGNPDARQCAWPSQLSLDLDQRGGHFEQRWLVAREQWIAVPGNVGSWPRDVTIDNMPAVVTSDLSAGADAVPRIYVSPGDHIIAGRFDWDAVPEKLRVPNETGLVTLYVGGEQVALPEREADGTLWLQRRPDVDAAVSQLNVVVHRLVLDAVPLQLITRIDLIVSGPGREVLLGRALPDGFIPLAFDTPLPARLEPDGRLRVQVRAGRWQLEIRARHTAPVDALTLAQPDGDWDADEIWVFQSQPHLRTVNVEGVDPVDPQQTELRDDWRQLPAYLMRPGATMKLAEQRRGDSDPAADELTLDRTLWLDFDGGGYTVHDRIGGTLRRSWRLEMSPPMQLGRVAVAGQDQFLTRMGANPAVGVEVRADLLNLDADARLAGDIRTIPAVGWDLDFNSVSGTLKLPPGWRLLHATGVDVAVPTWVTSWTLYDFFIVLIIVLAVARLWNVIWAALALVALGLTYNEPGAPQFAWIGVLFAEALLRVLPAGRLLSLVRLARLAAAVVLVVVAVPFMVQQARQGLYPVLERPMPIAIVEQEAVMAGSEPRMRNLGYLADGEGVDVQGGVAKIAPAAPAPGEQYAEQRYQTLIDPKAVVQTGPGLPNWEWKAVTLRWQGPVERQQQLHLYLVPPWATSLFALLRVLLIALLLVRLLPRPSLQHGALAVLTLLALAPLTGLAQAQEPPTALFDELRTRLIEPPACHPYCAGVARMRIETQPTMMRVRLEVHAVADGAIPLPGHASQWLPTLVVVDDRPGAVLARMDGTLWLHLPAGVHLVLLQGTLPSRDTVQVALPLRPQRLETDLDGWEIAGLHESGVVDDAVELTRISVEEATRAELKPGALPAFVSVERRILLPLSWRVETRVMRLSPLGSAVVLEVPLLAGESVTTPGIRVADGKVLVNLGPQIMATGWESTLAEVSPIRLQAPNVTSWTETWIVDASPIWHVEVDGIPSVHHPAAGVARVRSWQPWPGEAVAIEVTRPEGVPGQILTIDRSSVGISPGIRATDVTADIVVRSNRGTQHTFTLPDTAELQSVSIDGRDMPIRQEGARVTLPIAPGSQTVSLAWRQNNGIERRFTTPRIDPGAPSVNVELRVDFPADRWILFVGGPRLGPAVLFWSSLGVVLLVAFGLARLRITPLGVVQWFLLGVGLTQIPVPAAAVVVGWLLALGWRRRFALPSNGLAFNFVQLVLVLWTVAALTVLFWGIQQGLLGLPEMQIAGNNSSATSLRWFHDRAADVLPQATVVSVPLLVYRVLMLAWALWIAAALLGWLRWAWEAFSTGGYWRPLRPPTESQVPGPESRV